MKVYPTLEQAVYASSTTLLFRKGLVRKAAECLYQNEKIHYAGICIFNGNITGVLVITDLRVYGFSNIIGTSYYQEIPIDKIRNINYSALGGRSIQIYGETCTISGQMSNPFMLKTIQSTINELRALKMYSGNSPADSSFEAGFIKALKDLKELLDSGIITQEEFEAKKKQMLNL